MTTYITTTDTAKLLRASLKTAHPGVRFSVRSDSYAGGSSIRVSWTDGPTEDHVKRTTELYCGAEFDGMRDLKTHHTSMRTDAAGDVEEVQYMADFVFTTRELSANAIAFYAQLAKRDGHVDRPEQCKRCGDWIPADTDCYTARGRNRIMAFACSAVCAAVVTLQGTELGESSTPAGARETDTSSSASRQHYIDTGDYLTKPCEACGADAGDPCDPFCIGAANARDEIEEGRK